MFSECSCWPWSSAGADNLIACDVAVSKIPGWSPPRSYQLQGQVLAVRADTHEVLITHEDIKGFMPGMTMPFKVSDQRLLNDLAPGDLVSATLVVRTDTAVLSAITRTGTAPLPADAPRVIPAAAGITLLTPGAEAPATMLVGSGRQRPLSLAMWKGSAVAVTFIYTRCPLPQFCPLLDRRFAEVQRLAQDDPRCAAASDCCRQLRSGDRLAGQAARARRQAGRRCRGVAVRHGDHRRSSIGWPPRSA